MKTVIHLFPNGEVEVGTGGPGYRWAPAYSQVTSTRPGSYSQSQPLTRRHWQAIARRDGQKCVFHQSRDEAVSSL